jgi:hypothetical protein
MARLFFFVLAVLGLSGLAACSLSKFTDLENQAPAMKISQNGDIDSSSFGHGLVGGKRAAGEMGGALGITGNGDSSFSVCLFTASSADRPTVSQMDRGQLKLQLDSPTRMDSLAPAPEGIPVNGSKGPFAYLGSTSSTGSTVRIVDINKASGYVDPVISAPSEVSGFGLSVTRATFGTTPQTDLAVGAQDAVVLFREEKWPYMQTDQPVILLLHKVGSTWPAGKFESLVSGDLDADGVDEVVAGAPSTNTVVVIYGVRKCLDAVNQCVAVEGKPLGACPPCTTHLTVPLPDPSVKGFGGSLLVENLDGDVKGTRELVVGATESGGVYVYKLRTEDFLPGAPAPTFSNQIERPAGADGFGTALAYGTFDGKFDGQTTPLLAVGAPEASVAGIPGAGKIYLYSNFTNPVVPPDSRRPDGVSLASPELNTLLGSRLAVMPFLVPNQADTTKTDTYQLLAAAGQEAVYVFFSNLTKDHKDPRAY